jgi:hypothetical protein
MQPLLDANKTLDNITKKQSDGWQSNYNKHLETVFTNIAFEYLKNKKNNEYVSVFQSAVNLRRNWEYPPHTFEIDGLIYDEAYNVLYMIESKYHLTENELSNAIETRDKLHSFLHCEKIANANDPQIRAFNRTWLAFFDPENGIIRNRELTDLKAFLGFHSIESDALLKDAEAKGFQLIGPDGKHYKVYEPVN